MGLTVAVPTNEGLNEAQPQRSSITIACCGDSHTRSGYPKDLQKALQRAVSGVTWEVLNFGACGATASKTQREYGKTQIFRKALASSADIVALLLGTNDAHKVYWSEAGFVASVTDLVQQIGDNSAAKGRPLPGILLGVPPPLYKRNSVMRSMIQMSVVNHDLPRIIPQLAAELDLGVFDAFSVLGGANLLLPGVMLSDGVHMNQIGRRLLAQQLAKQVLIHLGFVHEEVDSPKSQSSNSTTTTVTTSPFANTRRFLSCADVKRKGRAVHQIC